MCRSRRGGRLLFVDIHIHVKDSLTVAEGHWIAHSVKDALCESDLNIGDVIVHVEPENIEQIKREKEVNT